MFKLVDVSWKSCQRLESAVNKYLQLYLMSSNDSFPVLTTIYRTIADYASAKIGVKDGMPSTLFTDTK